MGRIPTVRLRNGRTGQVVIINERDYASDIGGFIAAGFTRVGETGTDVIEVNTPPDEKAAVAPAKPTRAKTSSPPKHGTGD